MLLGCIADDFTGATDLANNLVRAGMRTIQTIGTPDASFRSDADAVVIALKSRTIPAADAVAQSLEALNWLRRAGCSQFYFKYCSTFDSTPAGNIGPVAEALMGALDCDLTIACPAFPENKRTVFKGYLFAGDVLLNESGMQNHPLTPMTDANLIRVLQAQTRAKVGHVAYDAVAAGPEQIRARFAALKREGVKIAIVDAISDADLLRIGKALRDMKLVTGGSGIAIGLPQNFIEQGLLQAKASASHLPAIAGRRAIVSGSCSAMTVRQVAHFLRTGGEACMLDALKLAAGGDEVDRILAWAAARTGSRPVLIYSTAEPERVRQIQHELGVSSSSALIENALAQIARGLVEAGVAQLIVAGGETAGAIVNALGIRALRIGPQIDPGVPWTCTVGGKLILLALKSGNFGAEDFFTRAFEHVEG